MGHNSSIHIQGTQRGRRRKKAGEWVQWDETPIPTQTQSQSKKLTLECLRDYNPKLFHGITEKDLVEVEKYYKGCW